MLHKEIPVIDMQDADSDAQLAFHIWSTTGSSDYSNDRNRPYTGQSWTDEGKRGETEVKGLTMRDIKDCLIKAILLASPSEEYLKPEVFIQCWDFSKNPIQPTQYLLDRQNDPNFVSTKVALGTWRAQDVYKVDLNKIDPLAIANNLTCEIEKMMGIFPNIEEDTSSVFDPLISCSSGEAL